jgi:electron transfer flavoprotein alpha subunit
VRIAALLKPIPPFDAPPSDVERRWLAGEGPLVMNPFCRRAVAQACELAAAVGDGTVTVVTVGPPGAADLVRGAMATGHQTDVVCHGLLIADAHAASAESLATARTLAAALEAEGGFDLVLTGRAGVDRDAGAVGPQLAELLGLPFVAGARYLSLQRDTLHVRCELDDGWAQVDVELPAVVSCAERLIDPCPGVPVTEATPSFRTVAITERPTVGSRRGTGYRPAVTRARVVLDGTPDEQVAQAASLLRDRGALAPPAADVAVPPTHGERGAPIAVVVEPNRAEPTRELLGAAARLAGGIDGHVVALTVAEPEPDTLASWGADALVHLDGSEVEEDVAAGVARWAHLGGPRVVLAPSTTWGREVAARAAAQLGVGLLAGAIAMAWDDEGALAADVPVLGGQLVGGVTSDARPALVTVRPGALALPRPRAAGRPDVRTLTVDARSRIRVRSRTRHDDVSALARAATVVGVGLGVDRSEYPRLTPLVEALGAELAATRPVTDRGWLPHARQVGLTGRSIAPRLYVAIGIRGAFQHLIGVIGAGTVLAVHPDPAAPVFDLADVGVVADWRDVVPGLAATLAGPERTRG